LVVFVVNWGAIKVDFSLNSFCFILYLVDWIVCASFLDG